MVIPPYHQILKSITDAPSCDPVLRMLERSMPLGNAHVSWTLLSHCLDRKVIEAEAANQLASGLLGYSVDVHDIRREHAHPFWQFWSPGGYRGAFRRYLQAHPSAIPKPDR